ncbi:MAG: hypothetical protein JNK05_37955 [Myxococcales bacterium]|nr:hypothetical protein [Myxococcales bacterium]
MAKDPVTRGPNGRVALSSSDDRARRKLSLGDGATLSVRIEGPLADVRVRVAGGRTLLSRSVTEREREDAVVELSIDATELDRWTQFCVLEIDARPRVAEHHREPAHDRPWQTLGVVTVRGARARWTLTIVSALASLLALVWLTLLPFAASSLRAALDVGAALVALSPWLAWLGLAGRDAPRIASALLTAGALVSATSLQTTVALYSPQGELQQNNVVVPTRLSRWTTREVHREGAGAVSVLGERFETAARCGLRGHRWPIASWAAQRYVLAPSGRGVVELERSAAEALGVVGSAGCDGALCCLSIGSHNADDGHLAPNVGLVPAGARIEVVAGEPVRRSALGLGAIRRLRWPLRDDIARLTFFNRAAPNVRVRVENSGDRDPFLTIGAFGAGWRGTVAWERRPMSFDRDSEFECSEDATELRALAVGPFTISRLEGRDWSASFRDSTRSVACVSERADREPVTLVAHTRTAPTALDAAISWTRTESALSASWPSMRLVRRAPDGSEVELSTTIRPRIANTPMRVAVAQLGESLRDAREIQLRAPGTLATVWRRGASAPPAVLLTIPQSVGSPGNSQRFLVRIGDGASASIVQATLVTQDPSSELREAPPLAAPECCRERGGRIGDCVEVIRMRRVPPRRRPVEGLELPGCSAVYDLDPAPLIRDPVRL